MAGAPFVAMETDLRKEERVAFTADLCGYNVFEALGRYFSLWSWCSDRGLEDAPDDSDGYAVPDAVVRRFLGARGVDGILGDGCDALAMGERRPDGLIYLRGTHKTVSRLRAARTGSPAGGRSAADRAASQGRGKGGRFVPRDTNDQPSPGGHPARHPGASSEIPDPRSQIPDPEDQKLTLPRDPAVPVPHQKHVPPATPSDGDLGSGESGARAKASAGGGHVRQGATAQGAVLGAGNVAEPQTRPTPDRAGYPPPNGASSSPTVQDSRTVPDEPAEYDPEDARARGRLAERIYRAVSDARITVAAELGLPAQLPFPPIAPSTSAGSFRDLRDRVREEGANAPVVCWRIVANLQAQAREDKSLEWLGEKAFREGSWRSAREWLPSAHRPRAGPKSSAARANSDPKIGRIEPPPASAFRGGIQKL